MQKNKVSISLVIENQLPEFIKEEYPLFAEFLSQYYKSLDTQSLPVDLIENIQNYIKLDFLSSVVESTSLTKDVFYTDTTINVASTSGFPESYGLIEIDSEIILYESKNQTQFLNCSRGFSGVSSLTNEDYKDKLLFNKTTANDHTNTTTVKNLSILFLKEFLKKVKKQFIPGFDSKEFYGELNESLFIKQSKDFYSSKGTENSFKILFRALYGEEIKFIRPQDYLFTPSKSQYKVTKDLVVEPIEGDPLKLVNRTIFQQEGELFNDVKGTVNFVQRIPTSDKVYYKLSLVYDFDETTKDKQFSVHPKTKIITPVSIGSSVIDVDSTVGFSTSGKLVAEVENNPIFISYNSKSLTQFFECSGVTSPIPSKTDLRIDEYAYGYSGLGTSNIVKFRITAVLNDINLIDKGTTDYYEGDRIQIKSLGIESFDIRDNNWIFNHSVTYDIQSVELIDISDYSYKVTTINTNNLSLGDKVSLVLNDSTEVTSTVVNVANLKTFIIKGQGQLNPRFVFKVRKQLSRLETENYPETSIYTTNVQNTYSDFSSTFITSPSLPTYFEQKIKVEDRVVLFSGKVEGYEINVPNHGFLTGESVWYSGIDKINRLTIPDGVYYIKKVDNNTIKLARTRSNIYNKKYIELYGVVTNNKFQYYKFKDQKISNQNLIRKISDPINDTKTNTTTTGTIGILVNGVEILNYKSSDYVYYGPIEEILVTKGGKNYDVINPPSLVIDDVYSAGVGATGFCEVEGSLERIDVIDGGFDYESDPVITIKGGNGSGVSITPNLISINHEVRFNSEITSNSVNIANNTIEFLSDHKFKDSESVFYKTNGQIAVGGLSTDAKYYVSIQSPKIIKLHNTLDDAAARKNEIDLTSNGIGEHYFLSEKKKRVISSINVREPGSGYRNRKIVIPSSGINTSTNIIYAKNHRYKDGDKVIFDQDVSYSTVDGLEYGKEYIVTKVDDDSFKLSIVGSATTIGVGTQFVGISTNDNFYYNTKQYIDIKSKGSGSYSFNHSPIVLEITSSTGLSTQYGAKLNPIFRGEIKSVFLEDGGASYGSEQILNHERQPSYKLRTGNNAQLIPVVVNGKIIDVVVSKGGENYIATPYLIVYGDGTGCVLSPVVQNGSIVDVKVVSSGGGYFKENTVIDVVPAGLYAKLYFKIKSWNLDLVKKLTELNKITADDGVMYEGLNLRYGLQYTHAYSPRKLRQTILSKKIVNGVEKYEPDLILSGNREIRSSSHSPIIGWAYDGNPIYGPYGYTTPTGGVVREMVSGYEIVSSINPNRPSLTLYPIGSFIEDYEFKGSGDLDVFNGRFCITPEYPTGTYAYFTTINPNTLETVGPFKNYKKPTFPYFIGNEFKSKPIDLNFNQFANQDILEIDFLKLYRNTTPYKFDQGTTDYEFISNPNRINKTVAIVKSTNSGSIDNVGILTGGNNYKVNDYIIFDNEKTLGTGAVARVNLIKGKQVNGITNTSTQISDVEIYPSGIDGEFIAFSNTPHSILRNEIVNISVVSSLGKGLNGFYPVGVRTENFILSKDVASPSVTGIVTYFYVRGNLSFPNIRLNDILGIGSEKIKVLEVDDFNSRIKILRNYDNTVGSSYTSTTIISDFPRKFTFNSENKNTSNFNLQLNYQSYFNPKESLGIGTTSGVGIGSTIFFSNPGVGRSKYFIPTKTMYIFDHGFETGLKLIYSSNGGSRIAVSTDGITNFQLSEGQEVYAYKIDNSLIGISTVKVGVGSTGSPQAIDSSLNAKTLYFTGIGTGILHSFKTVWDNVIISQVTKNKATVSTASTHGLLVNDTISFNCLPGITTSIVVKYNDFHRRVVINPREFYNYDVSTSLNTIKIPDHGWKDGQKIIYNSSSPVTVIGGLIENNIYYVIGVNKDYIKLAETYYDSTSPTPKEIDLTSSIGGTISPINPKIDLIAGHIVNFDLSDSSLAFTKNRTKYSAFKLNFYEDEKFKHNFESSGKNSFFEVARYGKVGIDLSARCQIRLKYSVPKILYYKLEPIDLINNTNLKKEILIDSEFDPNANKINVLFSKYTGNYSIIGVGSTSFSFSLSSKPEIDFYDKSNSVLNYSTKSLTAFGEIDLIKVVSGGKEYETLPGISSIYSEYGKGAIIFPQSSVIGGIKDTEILDIGVDYPTDYSLRPIANISQVIKVNPLYQFDTIGISSIGRGYSIPPRLIVLDGYTNQKVDNVDIFYELGDKTVTILNDPKTFYGSTPKIIPTNNSNGVGISTLSYDSITKDVTITLDTSYTALDTFPFSVNDRIFIENVSVGIGSTSKGYNSKNYNYELFTIKQVNPNYGSFGTITYNLQNYLPDGEDPGQFDLNASIGKVIREKDFPIFNISIKQNKFYKNESVISENILSPVEGIIESWDPYLQTIKLSSYDVFEDDRLLIGRTSKEKAIITEVKNFDAEFETDSFCIIRSGWKNNFGFLNDSIQRVQDSDYYQYFSYSINSKVPYDQWDEIVSSSNHISGFKKFSDLVIESGLGISATPLHVMTEIQEFSEHEVFPLLDSVTSIHCESDIDLAYEITTEIDSEFISNEIILSNLAIDDYIESVGNRVLSIDDISNQFNSEPRPTRYSVIETFSKSDFRTRKYLAFVRDRRFTKERQISLMTILQDGSNAFVNQYGRVETFEDMGSFDLGAFDVEFFGTQGNLLFYPKEYEVNNFDISFCVFSIKDSQVGVGTINLGDVSNIQTIQTTIPSGSTGTNIVSIGSSYRALKILVEIGISTSNIYEFDEISLIHDGSEIEFLEYGQLTNHSANSFSSIGIGTYVPYISGSNLNIDFVPNVGLASTIEVNCFVVSIGSTQMTGIGTTTLKTSKIESFYTSISSSPTPTENTIASYSSGYSCAYYVVSIEDTTNQNYQLSELICVDEGTNAYITEFGELITNSGLGTFGINVNGGIKELKFTPLPNIDTEVRVYQNSLELYVGFATLTDNPFYIDLGPTGQIKTGSGIYRGTLNDVMRSFELRHRGSAIFQREFDTSDSNVINLTKNTVKIPNHFFVTGEKLIYTSSGTGTSESIGIGTTFITGIGLTDKLPNEVYVIRNNNLKIQFARTPEEALNLNPIPINLTSLGIGIHTLTSVNQNAKGLISIDNVIQSPLVATAITSSLAEDILLTDDIIKFSGITSFFGGDLIRIDDEVMRINTIGIGSTNRILVERSWMGTDLKEHLQNSKITKVQGDYNIVYNTINFVAAPYGALPIGTSTNKPDERDYAGITTHSSFSGRIFTRSGIIDSNYETYSKNYVFDDISASFNGITTNFVLKTNQSNISAFSTEGYSIILIDEIFQKPQRIKTSTTKVSGNYEIVGDVGITTLNFVGLNTNTGGDIIASNVPIGGVIISVGSTQGLGYQPLISAGGTAIVSGFGTISSISIGNTGSGYRSGIQTVNVGVGTSSLETQDIEYIGIASVLNGRVVGVSITNPGSGYTSTNPPYVYFDNPLSYTNIPLIYHSSSSGFGTSATIDLVVGQNSQVIDFELKNLGSGYRPGEVLTIGVGGTTGIPQIENVPTLEFKVFVDNTSSNKFSGWNLGDFQIIDDFSNLFDGRKRTFAIKYDGKQKVIRARPGSGINVADTLLVFVNDILQVPNQGYKITGGSYLRFTEAPKETDTCFIMFYKGTGEIDVVDVDVLRKIEVGDLVNLDDNNLKYKEKERIVTKINAADSIYTNPYINPGLNSNDEYLRALNHCKILKDQIVNGKYEGKDRMIYEPSVYPITNIIQSVGIGSTVIFVESVKPFFNEVRENVGSTYQTKIKIISQDNIVGASATALVANDGSIASISIGNGGVGYNTSPYISISSPVGIGTTAIATATISIGGTVSLITLNDVGSGYSKTTPPNVLIEVPSVKVETISDVVYEGDFGLVVGVGTTNIGISSVGLVFDLFIPNNSTLISTSFVGTAVTVSGIQTGYYFVIQDSNVGSGITSLYSNGSILSIGSSFVDNVYEVDSTSIITKNVIGVGNTYINRVTVKCENYSNLVGTSYTFGIYGYYTWGRISCPKRIIANAKQFNYYNTGLAGISTSATIQRLKPLRYFSYI